VISKYTIQNRVTPNTCRYLGHQNCAKRKTKISSEISNNQKKSTNYTHRESIN